MTLGKMTDADKIMNPQHCGRDPADIRIRIWINPEIWFEFLITFGWGKRLGRGLHCLNTLTSAVTVAVTRFRLKPVDTAHTASVLLTLPSAHFMYVYWHILCTYIFSVFFLPVPSTYRAALGNRAFPVAAARAWNSLPLETRACSSLLTFRRETKSHLFCQSYGWRGAIYSDGQQTSALSCATVLDLDFVKCPATVWWQHCNLWHLW